MNSPIRLLLATLAIAATITACYEPPEDGARKGDAPAASGQGAEVGRKIPLYRNTVSRPGSASAKADAFDTQAVTKPTVYIVNSTRCPYCAEYVERMKEFEAAYMAKGVDVVHVYPVREEPADEKREYHASSGFAGGLIIDEDAGFARALDVRKTPTAILTDVQGTILYRGRIDDAEKASKVKAHELAAAVDEHLAGKPVTVATTEPFG